MNVSDQVFSEMVRRAKEIQLENQEQSLDAIAMLSINQTLESEGLVLSSSDLGDVLFQVVYAMNQ